LPATRASPRRGFSFARRWRAIQLGICGIVGKRITLDELTGKIEAQA